MPIRNFPYRILACCLALMALGSLRGYAQISPGELSRYHANLEGLGNCTKCHELGQEVSNDKCLGCHTTLQSHIRAGRGYHTSGQVQGAKCRSCHSEHNGRDFELKHWPNGQTAFDHSQTGFSLEGGHLGKACDACHTSALIADAGVRTAKDVNLKRTFLGLGRSCAQCHADEHHGQLSDDCKKCHVVAGWKPAPGFDHAEAAYPLSGKHQALECEKCHRWQPAREGTLAAGKIVKRGDASLYTQFKPLDYANCTPCHSDAHAGKFGANCADCHTTAGFQTIAGGKFDHSKTGYRLDGAHAAVACLKCHRSGDMTVKLPHAACKDCHSDEHKGQFAARPDGGACDACHAVSGYQPSRFGIDEHAKTDFPLTGSHNAVPCNRCHQPKPGERGANFLFSSLQCQGCHADVHNHQLDLWIEKEGCDFCHNTDTWHRTSFDHKLARFPLEGKHREILCLKCHKVVNQGTPAQVVWMKPLSMECASCHTDPHAGQFAVAAGDSAITDCKRCHNPEGWQKLRFEHNRDAQFKLDGAHARVACAGCHPRTQTAEGTARTLYKPLKSQCADCHGKKS